jgi:hypothetical protein
MKLSDLRDATVTITPVDGRWQASIDDHSEAFIRSTVSLRMQTAQLALDDALERFAAARAERAAISARYQPDPQGGYDTNEEKDMDRE